MSVKDSKTLKLPLADMITEIVQEKYGEGYTADTKGQIIYDTKDVSFPRYVGEWFVRDGTLYAIVETDKLSKS